MCLLINERSEDITETIYSIAPKVKSFKVVTNNINSFLSLENDLYEEYGIPIQISNNTRITISILNLNLYPKEIKAVPKMKKNTSFIGI